MAVRKIDIDKCIGCGTCVESCPMDVFRLDTKAELRPQASPCSQACPLGVNQREYHHLLNLDLPREAAELLSQSHPMPAITGRICPLPCETACTRHQVDDAVNINGIEQFLGDLFLSELPPQQTSNPSATKLAIIGSGPAGLSAAFTLNRLGYQVTVFDKKPLPGGLLRYGIPAFRLDNRVVDRQIDYFERLGIEFVCNCQVGTDIDHKALVEQGFQAVLSATGASKPLMLDVPGNKAKGVMSAIEFLDLIASGDDWQRPDLKLPKRVAVVGGGSVSLDAARTAVRLGATQVHVLCLETLDKSSPDAMLALDDEILDALEEGVSIHPRTAVKQINTDGQAVTGVTCISCTQVRDQRGAFAPIYTDCVTETLDVEMVILAIGQTADPSLLLPDYITDQRGYIQPHHTTNPNHYFAAGDAVTGPSTVVEALSSGKQAAMQLHVSLSNSDNCKADNDAMPDRLADTTSPQSTPQKLPQQKPWYQQPRLERENRQPGDRVKDFAETRQSLTLSTAREEAQRCLTCGSRARIAFMDDCQVCRLCQHYCPTDAIEITDGIVQSSLHNFDVVKPG